MITFEFGTAQIRRLTGLRRFPAEREAAKELITALQAANDEETARRLVDDVLAVQTECPVPAQIREAARNLNQRNRSVTPLAEYGPKPALCTQCRGYGTVGTAPHVTFCPCVDGRDVETHPKLGTRYLQLLNRRLFNRSQPFKQKSARTREMAHV